MNERKVWAGDWSRFEEIARKWDEINKELGDFGMAELVSKTKSYRAYDQRWPFDNMAKWGDNLPLEDLKKESQSASVEDEVADRMDTQKLIESLTPRQKKIFDALREGLNSVEIEVSQGYNTNNAVRWHKHQIKKKYNSIKADRYEKRFEYVCRECGNIFEILIQEDEPACTCDSKNTLFIRQYFKPIFED